MRSLWNKVTRFLATEGGPTAVQYALLLLLALLTCLSIITYLGGRSAVGTYPPNADPSTAVVSES